MGNNDTLSFEVKFNEDYNQIYTYEDKLGQY